MSSVIQMDDGKLFTVNETAEEVMQLLGGASQGATRGRPGRPGEGASFARLTTDEGLPVYLNVDHIAFILEVEA